MAEKTPFDNHDNGEYRLAYKLSPQTVDRVLDFGCGDGYFIAQFKDKAREIYACDIDLGRLEKARKQYPFIRFVSIEAGKKLPFTNNFFDLVFMIGVLEHVERPDFVLKELARVLKGNGQIVIHVPHQGLLSPLDVGNFKFRFPGLHRRLYRFVFGKEKYQQEFVHKKKINMFGDFPFYKGMWHRHFSAAELKGLLSRVGFRPRQVVRFSFFLPLLNLGQNFYQFLFKKPSRFWHWLIRRDNDICLGSLSYDMILLAEKK